MTYRVSIGGSVAAAIKPVLIGLLFASALTGCTGGADVETDEPSTTVSNVDSSTGTEGSTVGDIDAEGGAGTESGESTDVPAETPEIDGEETTTTTVDGAESEPATTETDTTQPPTTIPDPGVSSDV